MFLRKIMLKGRKRTIKESTIMKGRDYDKKKNTTIEGSCYLFGFGWI